jgi:hypothetical protein
VPKSLLASAKIQRGGQRRKGTPPPNIRDSHKVYYGIYLSLIRSDI